MVARQVAEDDGVELDARCPVLREGVRADLEGARLVPGGAHLGEHALQVERLGRRELDRMIHSPDAIDDGAEKPRRPPRRAEEAGDEVSRGRLAVGAGDADDAEVTRRIAVPARRHERHGAARGGDDDLRRGDAGVALADERRGAGLDGGIGELVAVERESGDAKEKRAVGDVTRVVGEAPDLGAGVAAHRRARDPFDQLAQLHRGGFYQTPGAVVGRCTSGAPPDSSPAATVHGAISSR